MIESLIEKLKYSNADSKVYHSLPSPLTLTLGLISDFLGNNHNEKLCIVFPTKELAAQWISIPLTLYQIDCDFKKYNNEIFESYKNFKTGDKLLLNNEAVVQWIGFKEIEIKGSKKRFGFYLTKATKYSPSLEKSIPFEKIFQLQPTEKSVLSAQEKVSIAKTNHNISPIEHLLGVKTFGNREFLRGKTCLITKIKSFDESISNTWLNNFGIRDYFDPGKIDEYGNLDKNSPLVLANNLSNLALFVYSNSINTIIIDGISFIRERESDFADISLKKIPTILVTDLSEIESFETIRDLGFEFFNFTKENLNLSSSEILSPFHSFEKKLRKYISFNVLREICEDGELEAITQRIHSIAKDESNNDLNSLKFSLIQLTNFVSRIAHMPSAEEISVLNLKVNSIETLFLRSRLWLGHSYKSIEESISLLKSVVRRFAIKPPEKCARLKELMSSKQYDYIICSNEEEAKALDSSLPVQIQKPRVISVADVNDKLLSSKHKKAILTGWPKANNVNRIISSFLFSELTVLFYQFENKYFNSLQRRNRQCSENIQTTIHYNGTDSEKKIGFANFFSSDNSIQSPNENSFSILEFELMIDNSQYSKYLVGDRSQESIKAKRIIFQTNSFLYSTETHRFLVLKEEQEKKRLLSLQKKTLEELHSGDFIVLINTSTDILADLVEKTTAADRFKEVKKWASLWKVLLRDYYEFKIHKDFNRLVSELSKKGCRKHRLTIRNWLTDPLIIGPEDDSDLLAIAIVTNSKTLFDNVPKVRNSISTMIGWRMKASDYLATKIKAQIHEFTDSSTINKKTVIEGLGNLNILKVLEISKDWDNIDARYVNKLLEMENL